MIFFQKINTLPSTFSNAAIQAIGCLAMRACHTNNCPVGIATQKDHLRKRLVIDEAAQRLNRFFRASVELMQIWLIYQE